MLKGNYQIFILIVFIFLCIFSIKAQNKIILKENKITVQAGGKAYYFSPSFKILYRDTDPKLAMRRSGIKNVNYNVPTWLAYNEKNADLKAVEENEAQAGDGFDSRILKGKTEKRTPNYFNSGLEINLEASSSVIKKDTIFWTFPNHELLEIKAYAVMDSTGYPKLTYTYTPKKQGYFSVGYTGAPSFKLKEVSELWQPFIWQEKRFPDNAYLTLSYRAPLPTTLVNDGTNSIGVLATPKELPFQPLPTQENSRFGIIIRNDIGDVQPQLFVPVLGGIDSEMQTEKPYEFSVYLIAENSELVDTYEKLSRNIYGFKDFRNNDLGSLNSTLEKIIDYGNSKYSRYVDSLKGFEYSTDVPGAVKNVSSLNPIEIAMITDNKELFNQKAYPMMEFVVSREKLLFTLDRNQKIQHPSRKLNGKAASLAELTALYNIFNRENPFLLEMAQKEYTRRLGSNPESIETLMKNWINSLLMFKATDDEKHLKSAIKGADEYLKLRVYKKQVDFNDPLGKGFFFWDAFTNKWAELLELYEVTGDEKYLLAAKDGARRYTLHTWMSPKIPDTNILVNKDGKAPSYWYLKSKGHKQMYLPEEEVPAWRLSEIGLTPESSGTSTGHRAIFMANYAPWLLRIGHYTNDDFLKEVAKSAIIGRYKNFPGYHINTARTTAYEKEDYPLHEHLELSVNSFHYNHIMPMATMLIDYLVSDTWAKSDEKINFPSEFIEGYGYLKNKFYGNKKGVFYNIEDVQLWMPERLLDIDNPQLNYISARKGNQIMIAFTNQSNKIQRSKITFNNKLVKIKNAEISQLWIDNKIYTKKQKLINESFDIEVAPNGISAVAIDNIMPIIQFQDKILEPATTLSNNFKELDFGKGKAMIFNLGNYSKKVFIYLEDDDDVFKSVSLHYTDNRGKTIEVLDSQYPYEFTIDLEKGQKQFSFSLNGETTKGKIKKGRVQTLRQL